MTRPHRPSCLFLGGVVAWFVMGAERALGCAVCYGDPESRMAKGAVMGVFVMIGVVGFVLAGMAGTGLFWLHRGRRLARTERTASSLDDNEVR